MECLKKPVYCKGQSCQFVCIDDRWTYSTYSTYINIMVVIYSMHIISSKPVKVPKPSTPTCALS